MVDDNAMTTETSFASSQCFHLPATFVGDDPIYTGTSFTSSQFAPESLSSFFPDMIDQSSFENDYDFISDLSATTDMSPIHSISPPSVLIGQDNVASRSPARMVDTRQYNLRKQPLKRSQSPSSDTGIGNRKRRRLANPTTRNTPPTSFPIINEKSSHDQALEVYSSDPFYWSLESVLFALTSEASIDLVRSMNDSGKHYPLPPRKTLEDFIIHNNIDGYNLLLCTDALAMCNYAITHRAHQNALGKYIVRFRRRSPGYCGYCFQHRHPENFTADRLIDEDEFSDMYDRVQGYLRSLVMGLMYQPPIDIGMQYILHYPIGAIRVVKTQDGNMNYTHITNKGEIAITLW